VQGGIVFNIHANPFPDWYYKPASSCPACPAGRVKNPPRDTGACGRYAGYQRHIRRGQQPCAACLAAAAQRRLRARRRALVPA
jgi:hypothetical protein